MGYPGGTLRPGSQNAAEAAIADAKRDGRTSLFLPTHGIRSLPDALRSLSQLRSLHLQLSPGFVLPGWLLEMSSITELHLSTTGWTRLPPQIAELANLDTLSWMANDPDSDLDPDWL